MINFTEHRAKRLLAAAQYSGWDRPPYPFQTAHGRCIGRVHISRYKLRVGQYVIEPGLIPLIPEIEAAFKAQERRQNRVMFP